MIFLIDVIPFTSMKLGIRSPYVQELLGSLFLRISLSEAVKFYNLSKRNPQSRTFSGHIFEYLAHKRLLFCSETYRIKKLFPKALPKLVSQFG